MIVKRLLSQMMLDGCKIAPIQIRNRLFGADIREACAMGAAIFGGWNTAAKIPKAVRDAYYGILVAKCPVCGSREHIVPHLNDYHLWTREAIADYIAMREIELGITTDGSIKPEDVSCQSTSKEPETTSSIGEMVALSH